MRFKQLIVEARFDKQTTQISRAIINQYKKILDALVILVIRSFLVLSS